MCTVGFIDDDTASFDDYTTRLGRKKVTLICMGQSISKEKVREWVLENRIECLLIDFKLKPTFDYSGTELFAYMNSVMPDLPCLILTNYPEDSVSQKLVSDHLILERSELDRTDLEAFSENIMYHVDVFKNRVKAHSLEYKTLLEKKALSETEDSTQWTIEDTEKLKTLFNLLKSYGEVDDLPSDFITSEVGSKLDTIISKMNQLLKDIEK